MSGTPSPPLLLDTHALVWLVEGDALLQRMRDTPTSLGGSLEGLAQAGYQAAPLLFGNARTKLVSSREPLLNVCKIVFELLAPCSAITSGIGFLPS